MYRYKKKKCILCIRMSCVCMCFCLKLIHQSIETTKLLVFESDPVISISIQGSIFSISRND